MSSPSKKGKSGKKVTSPAKKEKAKPPAKSEAKAPGRQ